MTADPVDVAVDRALGLDVPNPVASAQSMSAAIVTSREVFDEHVRQQREILALQREAYDNLLKTARAEQENMVALLEKLGLVELREHAEPEYHGVGHTSDPPRDDGFIF